MSLPSAPSHGLLPRRRPASLSKFGGNEKPASLVGALRLALSNSDVRVAWTKYKQLHSFTHNLNQSPSTNDPTLLLSAHDHARLLAALTQHLRPSVAVVHAEMIVLNMKRAGFPLDVRDFNNLILIYARNEDLRSAVETFDALVSQKPLPPLRNRVSTLPPPTTPITPISPFRPVVPNLRSFHLLMSAYAHTGRVSETAATFNHLTKLYPTAANDPTAYSLLLTSYTTTSRRTPQDLAHVSTLFDAFNSFGTPDRRVLDAAVRAFGVCGDLPRAHTLFRSYDSVYGIPQYSVDSIDAYMSVLEVHGDMEAAESLYARFFSPTNKSNYNLGFPLAATFKSLMRLNLAAGNLDRVKQLFGEYKETQLVDAQGMEILLDVWLTEGNVEEADKVYEEMQVLGYKIRSETVKKMERARDSLM
ncbi:hypothetical protein HDU79_011096 [Rhizoclosmatium sp. JEL0117]|nr:hypothetical protein HDU79_011096 [Rhizoclosmatium sp. JEL0117]